jgi:predicted hydrocarbon binding protein
MAFEDSYFLMHGQALKDLREELDNIVGDALSKGLLFRYGFRCGECIANSIGIHTTKSAISKVLPEVWSEVGLGRIVIKLNPSGKIFAIIEDAIEAEANGKRGKPSCDFTRGYLAGLVSSLMKKSYYCIEEKCVSKGDAFCKYLLTKGE